MNTLQVTVQDWDGRTYVAYYQSIVIGSEEDKYSLSLSGYDNVNSTLADAFAGGGNVGASFTTWDSDNDAWATDNCGKAWWSGKYSCNYHIQNELGRSDVILETAKSEFGTIFHNLGWWFSGCGTSNLNGLNSDSQLSTEDPVTTPFTGIVWYNFYGSNTGRGASLEPDGGSWKTFKATEMRITTDLDVARSKCL